MLFLTLALTIYLLFLAAVIGLITGSFVNCWAWRIVNGEQIARGRSHCTNCGHVLSPLDLVPLFSFLFLRGKCRYCGHAIAWRYPAAEAVSALFFVSVLLRYDVSWDLLRFCIVGAMLLTLSLVDLDTFEIPDRLLFGIALSFPLRFLTEGTLGIRTGLIAAFAISVPLLLFVLLFDHVLGKESMGGGDIKLFFVLGLHFSPALLLMMMIFACCLGIIFAIYTKKMRGQVPFGPAISAAAWIILLVGEPLLHWYLGLF